MAFDWVTWSIWAMGLVILVIWTIVPIKEFIGIVKVQHEAQRKRAEGAQIGVECPPEKKGK
jgi:uncharacterized membrane protein YcjF (UPF0283 family)